MFRLILSFLISSALFLSINGCKKEDNAVDPITNNPPTVPVNPFPADNATGLPDSSAIVLTWESTDPDLNDTLKFDVFVGTSLPLSNVPIAANLLSPQYNMGMLPFPGTTYYWMIRAKDNWGAEAVSNVWRFTIRTYP